MSHPSLFRVLRGEASLARGASHSDRFVGESRTYEFATKKRKVEAPAPRVRPGTLDVVKPDFHIKEQREDGPLFVEAGGEGEKTNDYHFATAAPSSESGSSDGHGGGMTDGVKGVVNEINKKKIQTQSYADDTWNEKEKRKNSFENVS